MDDPDDSTELRSIDVWDLWCWFVYYAALHGFDFLAGLYSAVIVICHGICIDIIFGFSTSGALDILRRLVYLLGVWKWHFCAGADYILADYAKWVAHDAPNGPPLVTKTTAVRTTIFFISAIWGVLDWRYLLNTITSLSSPIGHQLVLWSIFFSPDVANLLMARPALPQIGTDTALCIYHFAQFSLLWGILACIMAFWYRSPYALDIYSVSYLVLMIVRSRTSERNRILVGFCAMMPWIVLWAIINLITLIPFGSFRTIWLLLQVPYWQVRHWLRERWFVTSHKPCSRRGRGGLKYKPLLPGHIRVLEVNRNPNSLDLECRLQHVHLSQAGEYDAISYTWEKQSDGKKPSETRHAVDGSLGDYASENERLLHGVIVDDSWIEVGTNAYELLQDRATTNETRRIWMDCLCINQEDKDEKCTQIPMMGEIYQNAKRTIVWLGNIKFAEQCLSLLQQLSVRPLDLSVSEETPGILKSVLAVEEEQRSTRYSTMGIADPRFRALADILEHDWFYRLWILQEVIFSNKIHIRVSGIWIDWDLFTTAMKLFSDPKTYMLCGREALYIHLKDINVLPKIFLLTHAKDLERARLRNNQSKPKLSSLLLNLWITRASDGRDMIYGLLNLCSDGAAQCLVPNYDRYFTAEALFVKFGELCLQREEFQDILYLAGIGYPRNLSIPSWSPDWTSIPLVPTLRNRGYKASGDTAADFKLLSQTTVSASSVSVDKIIQIADKAFTSVNFAGTNLMYLTTPKLRNIEFDAQNMSKTLPDDYDSGSRHSGLHSREEAFWRTLIGDTEALPSRAQSESSDFPYNFELKYKRPASPEFARLFNAECAIRDRRHSEFKQTPQLVPGGSFPARTQHQSSFEFIRLIVWWFELVYKGTFKVQVSSETDYRFTDAFASTASGRKFAIAQNLKTGRKRMALVPPLSEVWDDICIIRGMEVPFVLRRSDSPSPGYWFRIVGECYVHGIMDGEALSDDADTRLVYFS